MENIAAAILATIFAYRVEIERPAGWTHIHHPDWETTESYPDAMAYARTVLADHPGAAVRIVETAEGYPDHHIPVT